MLDLSTKNVVLAVRYYQPLTDPTPFSACAPSTASSSVHPVLPSTAAMTPPAVAIVYPVSPSTVDTEDTSAATVNADSTPSPLHVQVEKMKALDSAGSRGMREGEDVGGRSDDFSPLKDDSSRSPKKETLRPPVLPVQRIILSTEDLVLSFGRAGRRRRRVLGRLVIHPSLTLHPLSSITSLC